MLCVSLVGSGVWGRMDTCIHMAESLHCSPETTTTFFTGHVHAKLLQSCQTVCNPMDCSPPGSPVHGFLQARILEWIAMTSSKGIFQTQGSNLCLLHLPHRKAGSLPLAHLGSPNRLCMYAQLLPSCVTLSDPTDCSLPGSSVHGIL